MSSLRLEFVQRLRAGERMSDLCREYGISRPTGYKFKKRYDAGGPEALGDYSRRPYQSPTRTAEEIEQLILDLRRQHPTWGAKKLKVVLEREHTGVRIPAVSSIGRVLQRHQVTAGRLRKRKPRAWPTLPLTQPSEPNHVWGADFKGQFRLKDGTWCYPLTVTDLHTRRILGCEALESTGFGGVFAAFNHIFAAHGLPKVIRTDNGTPFASQALLGLTRLSVWWMRLGIEPERIATGSPQQNGSHERMHLTLKAETVRPAAANLLQQQERFDRFIKTFNEVRPHEALGMATPASRWTPSPRRMPELLPDLTYPLHERRLRVHKGGSVRLNGKRAWVGEAFCGEYIGARQVEQDRWTLSFLDKELGVLDTEHGQFAAVGQRRD